MAAKDMTTEEKKVMRQKLLETTRLRKFDPEFIDIARRMKAAGISNKDLAFFLGVHGPDEINDWLNRVPEFKEALEQGRDIVRTKLIAKGIESACGYDYTEEREKWVNVGIEPDGSPRLRLKEKQVDKKHQPSNPRMLMSMLAILDPEFRNIWSQAERVKKNVTLKIDGSADSEQLKGLFGRILEEDSEGPRRKPVVSIEIDKRIGDRPSGKKGISKSVHKLPTNSV